MNRETLVILIKSAATLFGSYLIGDNIFGTTIDYDLWQVIVGVILSGASIFWSIKDKTYQIESIQAFVRQAILVGGGFLIASGRITQVQLEGYVGIALALIPIVQSYLSKKKAAQVQEGTLNAANLASIPKDDATAHRA